MRNRILARGRPLALGLLLTAFATSAGAESWEGVVGGRRFHLPDLNRPVRGVLVNNTADPAGGASWILWDNKDWRELARVWNLVQIEWHGRFNRREDGRPEMQSILDRLDLAAKLLGKPEIAQAPVFTQGLSGCACDAAWLAEFPELKPRVAGVIQHHECDVKAPADIPALCICAGSDYMVDRGHPNLSLAGHLKLVAPRARNGEPETVSLEPGQTHHIPGEEESFTILWMDEILRLRAGLAGKEGALPPVDTKSGWAGRFQPGKEGKALWNGGDRMLEPGIDQRLTKDEKDPWIWLPTRRVAQAWLEQARNGLALAPPFTVELAVAGAEPPPATAGAPLTLTATIQIPPPPPDPADNKKPVKAGKAANTEVKSVDFYDDTRLIAHIVKAGGGGSTVWTKAAGGTHRLLAVAVAADGTWVRSNVVVVQVARAAEPDATSLPGLEWSLAVPGCGGWCPDVMPVPVALDPKVKGRKEGEAAPGTPLATVTSGTAETPDLAPANGGKDFILAWSGLLAVPQDGAYTFTLGTDQGSKLIIGGERVIDRNDRKTGSGTITLAAGKHPLAVLISQKDGSPRLELRWSGPGVTAGPIPAEALFHKPGKPGAKTAKKP
jgi:hypothetical protein